MSKKDVTSGVVWLLIGLAIIIGSLVSLDIGTTNEPGPALFPLIAGILVGLLSLIVLSKAAFVRVPEKWSLRELWGGSNRRKVFYVVGALLTYAVLLEAVGFLLMTLLMLIFLLRKIEPQKWKVTIGLSILGSVGSYLIFDRLLQAQLPKGFLGF